MKKIVICLLSALFIVTVFTACGNNNNGNNTDAAPTQSPYTDRDMIPDADDGRVGDTDGIIEPDDNGTVGDGTGSDTGIMGGSTTGNGTTTGSGSTMGNGSAMGSGSSAGTGASSAK